jgi:hypothetical protein
MKKHSIYSLVVMLVTMLAPLALLAQPVTTGEPSAPGAPIDGGLSVLIVAGAGYGYKKLKESREQKAK